MFRHRATQLSLDKFVQTSDIQCTIIGPCVHSQDSTEWLQYCPAAVAPAICAS